MILSGLMLTSSVGISQIPPTAIVALFDTYRIVMFGEMHECKQEYDMLGALIATPGFAGKVNDIVVEFGNARYQDWVDRYVAGDDVPEIQKAWQDVVGALGPVSPVYGEFYAAVRNVNRKLPKQNRLRILLGDPPIDWSRVQSREDIAPYLPFRDEFYASVVRDQVIARKRKALLIMGGGHFQRRGGQPGRIENELLTSLVKPYVILAGSNMVGGYLDLEPRFDSVAWPSLIELKGSWVGSLSTPGRGGTVELWDQRGDAYLYLGPRDQLTVVKNRREDLEGTAYGKEVQRRLEIIFDKAPDFLPAPGSKREQPAFTRTSTPGPALPALPKPKP
ncbi:MAG TPA: hypothetical protein VK752_31120 [Bryobacteraceae bacterium]|nr:hypothetical protein [Bryobacteraceae bacterium]